MATKAFVSCVQNHQSFYTADKGLPWLLIDSATYLQFAYIEECSNESLRRYVHSSFLHTTVDLRIGYGSYIDCST